MPIFILALVRIRVLSYDKLRRNRKLGLRADARLRDPAPDRRPRLAALRGDPAPDPLRGVHLDVEDHGEALGNRHAPLGLRRGRRRGRRSAADRTFPPPIRPWRTQRCEGRLGGLGDPGRGHADRDGAVAIADDGTIAAVGPADGARAGRAPRGLRDRARASSTRTRTSSTPSTRASATGSRSCPGSGSTSSASRRSTSGRHARDRHRRRARVPSLGHHDDRRLQLLGRRRHSPLRRRGCARSSTSRSSAVTSRPLDRFHELHARGSSTRSPTASASASRRTRRTRARSRSTAPAPRSASLRRRISPRAPPNASGSSAGRATGARSPTCSCRPPGETGIRLLAAEGLLGPGLVAAHCVHADAEEIELLAAARRRRRALPALERLPRLRRRPAGGAAARRVSPSRSRPTAPPRRRRSTCSRRSGRAIVGARARAGDPTPSRRRRASSSRRSAARAFSGWTTGSARSCPGKQADLTVVSLAGLAVRSR